MPPTGSSAPSWSAAALGLRCPAAIAEAEERRERREKRESEERALRFAKRVRLRWGADQVFEIEAPTPPAASFARDLTAAEQLDSSSDDDDFDAQTQINTARNKYVGKVAPWRDADHSNESLLPGTA